MLNLRYYKERAISIFKWGKLGYRQYNWCGYGIASATKQHIDGMVEYWTYINTHKPFGSCPSEINLRHLLITQELLKRYLDGEFDWSRHWYKECCKRWWAGDYHFKLGGIKKFQVPTDPQGKFALNSIDQAARQRQRDNEDYMWKMIRKCTNYWD